MKQSFRARYVEIKRKIVNLYTVIASLDEQLYKISDNQKFDLYDAVKYMNERIEKIREEIKKVIDERIEELKNVSKGISGFVIASKIQKMNRLEEELNECKKSLKELTEQMNKRWGR